MASVNVVLDSADVAVIVHALEHLLKRLDTKYRGIEPESGHLIPGRSHLVALIERFRNLPPTT